MGMKVDLCRLIAASFLGVLGISEIHQHVSGDRVRVRVRRCVCVSESTNEVFLVADGGVGHVRDAHLLFEVLQVLLQLMFDGLYLFPRRIELLIDTWTQDQALRDHTHTRERERET